MEAVGEIVGAVNLSEDVTLKKVAEFTAARARSSEWAHMARATPLPDAPLKLVAAAAGYPVGRYALAIFLGALPYYFALVIAGRKFKPPAWLLVAATVAIALGVLIDRLRRRQDAK